MLKNFVLPEAMRPIIKPRLPLGARDIAALQLDPRSREGIPRLLRGRGNTST
jgi:hypothetical protein